MIRVIGQATQKNGGSPVWTLTGVCSSASRTGTGTYTITVNIPERLGITDKSKISILLSAERGDIGTERLVADWTSDTVIRVRNYTAYNSTTLGDCWLTVTLMADVKDQKLNHNNESTLMFEIPPQRNLTLSSDENGTLTADRNTGYEGNIANLIATPAAGYKLDAYQLTGGGSILGNKYRFGKSDGSIRATFTYGHNPVVDTFYYLTYFVKNSDGTIRGYSLGEPVNTTPSGTFNYKNKTATTSFGQMNFVGSSSRTTASYWARYQFTRAQAEAWKTGAIQYEFVWNQTAWAQSDTFITSAWWMHQMDYQGSRFEILKYCRDPSTYPHSSITSYDSRINAFSNYEWTSFQSNKSNWGSGTWHVVIMLSLKDKKTLVWINGKLVGRIIWKDAWVNARISNLSSDLPTFSIDPCRLGSTVWLSQFGVRPAVWTLEQDYTAPTQPYLAMSEYY